MVFQSGEALFFSFFNPTVRCGDGEKSEVQSSYWLYFNNKIKNTENKRRINI